MMKNYNKFLNMHCDVRDDPTKFETVWRNKKDKLYYGVK